MLPIAEEGRIIILVVAVVAVITSAVFGVLPSSPLWISLALLLFVFRRFPRTIPSQPLAALSPVDGRIIDVCRTHDPFLNRDALAVRMRQNSSGEFTICSPIEGKIKRRWLTSYHQDKAREQVLPSGQFALWFQSDERDDVVVAVDLESPLHLTRCAVHSGDRIGQGQRCGFIGFGRRINVYFPVSAHAKVQTAQRVKAGSDMIVKLASVTTSANRLS